MLRLALLLTAGIGIAACAGGQPPAPAPATLGALGPVRGELKLTLKGPLVPHLGTYRLPLELSRGGMLTSAGQPSVSMGAVRYDLADRIAPGRVAATLTAVQARLIQLLEREWAAAEREIEALFAGHPKCDGLTPAQKAGKVQRSFNFSFQFPQYVATFRWCYVVSGDAPNKLFDYDADFERISAILTRSLSAIEGEFSVTLIPVPAGKRPGTNTDWLLRPHYAGAVAGSARDLAPVSLFVVRTAPARSDREYIGLAASIVQRAANTPIVLQSEARVTELPSPAAVLVDLGGPPDAKAVTIATLLRTLLPDIGVVLVETGGAYLLGLAIPAAEGDVVVLDRGATYVALDPWAETPVGRIVQPSLQARSADGVLSAEELDVVYDLRPGGGVRRYR